MKDVLLHLLHRHLLPAVALAAALAMASIASATAPPFPSTTTQTFVSDDTEIPIPDASSVISLMTLPQLAGLQIIDVDVVLAISHTNAQDLDISLVSPSGTTITLTTDNGAGNDDVFNGTTFDDQAAGTPSAPNVRNVTYTNLVAVPTVQPEEPLAALFGEPAMGPWVLVVVDDTNNGNVGTLHGWSLVITTLPIGALTPSAPVSFAATTAGAQSSPLPVNIPDNNQTGLSSTITVSGVGNHLFDVDVTTDIQHNRSGDLDLFLTAPSGKRIDLVTALGGNNVDLYRGTIWDDQAGVPIADGTLPVSPNPFVRTPGEGALAQFLGDDPNGDWVLTVVDHTGGTTGKLNGWSLSIVTAAICGNGTTDAGELCDDGNLVDGDGCDSNCTPTACGNGVKDPTEECDDGNTVDGDECPASCHFSEVNCGDCNDDDVNGKVDALDPACNAGALTLTKANVAPAKGHSKLTLNATAQISGAPSGTGGLVLADGTGPVACAVLGAFQKRGKKYVAAGSLAGAPLSLTVVNGKIMVKGKGLDLPALDDPQLAVGVRVGSQLFAGGGALRSRGPRKVFP